MVPRKKVKILAEGSEKKMDYYWRRPLEVSGCERNDIITENLGEK